MPATANSVPAAKAAAPVKVACPKDRPDVTAAAVSARLCGGRVEARDLLSETTQTWVNPDGTVTQEQHLGPVRMRQGDSWVPLDFTLQRMPGGGVAAKAHPSGLRLSGAKSDAGEHDVVTLGSGNTAVGVSWAGRLPEPVLAGPKATYRDVLPSVDLVVEATRTGYKQLFVVKDRAGLASVARIPLALKTGALSPSDDGEGGVAFKDAKGAVVSRTPALEMWDSTVDAASGEHIRRARVGFALKSRAAGVTDLVLMPDAVFMARGDVQFPLMIDPPATLGPSFDAFVQTGYTSDQSASTELRLGTYDGGTNVARSYLTFPTSGLWDTTVMSASLNLYEFHSYQCAQAVWESYRSPAVSSSVRWSNKPAPNEQVGFSWLTTGYNASCGAGFVGINVQPAMQYAASNHSATSTIMLKAMSETANSGWKKFNSSDQTWGDPYVSITYNVLPVVPWGPTIAPCNTGCDFGARVQSTRPTLSAHLHDDNSGQALDAQFEVRDASTLTTVSSSGWQSGTPAWTAGSVATWQVSTTLVSGTNYEWRIRTGDRIGDGPWSGWIGFTVDTTAPGVPIVAGALYANDGQPHGGAGIAGSFTFTPPAGTTDLAAFIYTLASPSATLIPQTTLTATGPTTVPITPSVDGNLTLTVWAKDRAGNQSNPNTYLFKVGSAALAQPLPGANVVRRMKLSVDSAIADYTRGYFEYRRGPGSAALVVPSANLTTATGASLTATAAAPATFANLGGYAVWSAADTLGLAGGVVEVRAQVYTSTSSAPVFATPWVRVNVDADAGGAAGTSVGPGSVNLLTGDYTLSSTDTDDLGLSVDRTASSRKPADGFVEQQERLTANQQQVSSSTAGFNAGGINCATMARATALGQGESTDSLEITPSASCVYANESYAAIDTDTSFGLGMQTGKTYRATAWIYVPAATGLTPGYADRGLRIMAYYQVGLSWYGFASAKAAYTDAWQELTVDLPIAADANLAFFRLYNGNAAGSGKKVYWDNISVKEIVSPFGPSWAGGATGGPAAAPYTTLEFPQPVVAPSTLPPFALANTAGGGWVTFSLNADHLSYTPEPGAEGLVLSKSDANTYRITDMDGTVADFTQQGAAWTLAASRTTESASTAHYVYDTTNSRALLKKVINPVEPGVDDTNACTGSSLPAGCEVLEYVYATSTTSGLSQTVFGDYLDHVKQVELWASDPTTGTVSATAVTEYRYDVDGELREVWDPRVSPALKTTYDYGLGGRVTSATPPGELPWQFIYGNPDVDAAAVRWDLDQTTGTNAPDSSGNSRDGTLTSGTWVDGTTRQPSDKAVAFTGSSGNGIARSAGSGVATNQSFTVSAWVTTTDSSTITGRTAVSQDGANVGAFELTLTYGKWTFTRQGDDSTTTIIRAQSTDWVTPGAWTHLTGVYDATNNQISLYVNGVLNSVTSCSCNWNATGAFNVGKTKWAGSYTNWWQGNVDDVRVYPKILSTDQIANLAGDKSPGRLVRVERAALQQGSPTATDGTVASNVVYHVPLSTAAGGPYNLDGPAAATWGQTDIATDATAVFGPEDVPARNSATPASPGPSGYPYATVSYLNPNGKGVNTATPGGHIDTVEYDKFGNTVRTLQATDREIALGVHPKASTYLADLGLTSLTTVARANALATVDTFSPDGLDQLATTGPTMRVVLEQNLVDPDGGGPLIAITAGATVIARSHTVNTYDENKPDGANYHLLTTTSSGASVPGYPDADTRSTTNAYNAAKGGTSGWTLRKPTTVVNDSGPGGAALTSHVVHDAAGRETESWGIGATGGDARTTKTIYYTAGTNAVDAACGSTPKWAGNTCVTKKAGAITGHDAARMATNLAERRLTAFTRWGDVGAVTETVPGTTASRTTTTTYDAAGRVTAVGITSAGDAAAALSTIATDYSATTGKVTQTHAGAPTITREYDNLGRLYRYTDADGGITTNEFDRYGKASKVSDPTGNATYTYNRNLEPRGFLTSTTDSMAGTFNAEYSPDGQLTVLHYPTGMTRTDTLDANLKPALRTYTRDSDNAVIYHDAVVTNVAGQIADSTYTGGSRTYSYDRVGRLTAAAETTEGSACTTRTYTYDTRTNRTSGKTYNPDAAGNCRSTGTPDAQTDHAFDSADRITDTGYTYDPFGRVTATAGGSTNTFYANDLVASQVLDTSKQAWSLDPKYRYRAFNIATYNGSAWTTVSSRLNHYGDDSDSPRWIVEDTGTGVKTRMILTPDGDLGGTATTAAGSRLNIVNLHGDAMSTVDGTLLPPSISHYDEYGMATTGESADRYGWLGGKQRSSEAIGGTILMGVRLYQPNIGRFLSVDPVAGGSCNSYDYVCADPANKYDLDGTWIGLALRGVGSACKVARSWCARTARWVGSKIGQGAGWVASKVWQGAKLGWSRLVSASKWTGTQIARGARAVNRGVTAAWQWGMVTGISRTIAGHNCGQAFSAGKAGGYWAYGLGFALGFMRNRGCGV